MEGEGKMWDQSCGLLSIKRIDKMLNSRELCGMKKRVDERTGENVCSWCGYTKKMENSVITKRTCRGKCIGNSPVGRP